MKVELNTGLRGRGLTERWRLQASEQLPPASVHEQAVEFSIQGGQVLGQRVGSWSGDTYREHHGNFPDQLFYTPCVCVLERTDGEDEEADVVQPIGRLAGELLHKAAEDGAEVALISTHRHLHRGRRLRVTVTAARHSDQTSDHRRRSRSSIISY